MRLIASVAALALLVACTPPALREEAGYDPSFPGNPPPQQPYGALQSTAPADPNQAIPSSDINSALFGTPAPGAAAGPVTPAPLSAIPAEPQASATPVPAPQTAGTIAAATSASAADHSAISDEQDFKAVSSRETIEGDKARIEQNRAKYQQIEPTALPERSSNAQVSDVIAYATNATNRLGQSVYERKGSAEKSQANCLKYTSEEAAQAAFLKAGGPKRDPKNLDPDGDGFACGFDPTPFQSG